MTIEEVYDYFHNYDSKVYQIFACMGNEPSEKDILNFEKQYDVSLPDDFKEFKSKIDPSTLLKTPS